ncbi:hypothetical protein [Flavobacterium chilense]|uniref:Uncharacterized protein n=1 Tax=Flavobacterium chilense TaxID=946677 RepID=A0A1M7IYQ1_9FLAO|nr:hypothetical protein [Flavobacterium chilense]SHM45832.1 hypothetical protein SAMN05444484_106102 [Flavobacterium chilense]
MSFFKFLFGKSKIECPRCLGKKFVDWEDIIRLNNQLKWTPGPCAYCNATGKVTEETLAKVAVNNVYLTFDLPESEMEKIKNGDPEMLEKTRLHELFVDNLIKYAEHHYITQNMDAQSIADLYLSTEDESAPFSVERKNLISYIEKIIELKKAERN